jgi:hypothetical protein
MSVFHESAQPAIFFHVRDMTCARAATAIACAIKLSDADAKLRIDLPMRRIEVVPGSAQPSDYRDAIGRAGYTAVRQWPSDLMYLLVDPFFAFSVPTQTPALTV